MPDLDEQINAAHADLEKREQEARKLEQRLRRIPGLERLLPIRNYGRPVDVNAIKGNLTAVSLINSYDEALASYLQIQTGTGRKARELREAARMQAEALRMKTDRLAAENAFRREQLQRTVNAGINPNNGRRFGT